METVYFGANKQWDYGAGADPWIMADLEWGLFSGVNAGYNDIASINQAFRDRHREGRAEPLGHQGERCQPEVDRAKLTSDHDRDRHRACWAGWIRASSPRAAVSTPAYHQDVVRPRRPARRCRVRTGRPAQWRRCLRRAVATVRSVAPTRTSAPTGTGLR